MSCGRSMCMQQWPHGALIVSLHLGYVRIHMLSRWRGRGVACQAPVPLLRALLWELSFFWLFPSRLLLLFYPHGSFFFS